MNLYAENAANQVYRQFFALTGHLSLYDKAVVADRLYQLFEKLSMELEQEIEEYECEDSA